MFIIKLLITKLSPEGNVYRAILDWCVQNDIPFHDIGMETNEWDHRMRLGTVEITKLTQFQYIELAFVLNGDYKIEFRYLP